MKDTKTWMTLPKRLNPIISITKGVAADIKLPVCRVTRRDILPHLFFKYLSKKSFGHIFLIC